MHSPMLILAGLVCTLQDPTPAPIEGTIESWYRVERRSGSRSEHVGFGFERIEEVRRQDARAFLYDYRVHASWLRDGREVRLDTCVNAILDDRLRPTALSLTYSEGDRGFSIELVAQSGRSSLLFDRKPVEDAGPPPDFLLPLAMLRLRQNGLLLRRGSNELIRLPYPRGEQEWNVVETKLEVLRHSSIDRLHEGNGTATVTVLAVTGYPAASRDWAIQEALLDRWGRTVRMSTQGGLDIAIARTRAEAVGDALPDWKRRDPFDKQAVLTRKGKWPQDPTWKDGLLQKKHSLEAIRESAEAVLEACARGDDGEASKRYRAFLEIYARRSPVRSDPFDDEAAEIRSIKRKVEWAYDGAARLLAAEGSPLEKRLQEAARNLDAAGVEGALKDLESLRSRPEFDGAERGVTALEERIAFAEVLAGTVFARRELLSLPLRLAGTSLRLEESSEKLRLVLRILGHQIDVAETVNVRRWVGSARIEIQHVETCCSVGDDLPIRQGLDLEVADITRYSVTVAWPAHERKLRNGKTVTVPRQLREISLGQ